MNARDSKSQSVNCRFSAIDAVHGTTTAARDFADQCHLRATDGARLAVIVEELITNIVEHGGVAAQDPIELSLFGDGVHIGIVIVDTAPPFDPRSREAGDAMPERGGGAGIDLVRAWTTIVDYAVADGRNRLELSMPIGR